jgi:hypothetical protein
MIDVHKDETGYVAKLHFETGEELLKEIYVLGSAIGETAEICPAHLAISMTFLAGMTDASNEQEKKEGEKNGRKNYAA